MSEPEYFTAPELIAWMREHGVKRVDFHSAMPRVGGFAFESMELFDTIPAMPTALAFEPDEPAPEEKPPGICVHPGCGEKNGWQFAREFCRDHGLAAAGVTRAR